jgi:type II secretory pathway pseudopilin PulG
MADGLAEALLGLNFTPAEDPYGIAAQGLAASTPQLITPYTSTGKAIGIGLGSILLQSLLGYQARQEASRNTLELNTLANSMQGLGTAQERTNFIKQVDNPMYQSRLSSLATALNTQDLDTQNAIKRAAGLETGKMKALQEFYASPEGEAQREFELNKIREEAQARRTPLEDYLARTAAQGEEQRKTAGYKASLSEAAREKQNAFTAEMKELDRKARSGDQQAKFDFQAKQQQVDADLKRELVELGVNAAVDKKRKLDELTMQNREAGQDPQLALINAKAEIAKELVEAREAASGRLIEKARQEREQEAAYKRTLEMANPKAPAALVTENVKRIGASNMAVDIANDLDRYHNWITYRVGTAFSAVDEEALRQRIKKLSFEERKALSGLATTDREKADINEMLNGDFTAGPETKAMLLRRFASDSRRLAVDNMKGGFASAADFIKAVEQGMQSGGRVEFGTPQMQGASTAVGAAQTFVSSLKEKYGADWKTKMTPAEKTAAAALLQARGQ